MENAGNIRGRAQNLEMEAVPDRISLKGIAGLVKAKG